MNRLKKISRVSAIKSLSIAVLGMIALDVNGEAISRNEFLAEAQLESACRFSAYMDCLGVKQNECESAVKKCVEIFPDTMDESNIEIHNERFDECMNDLLSIDEGLMESCESASDRGYSDIPDNEPYPDDEEDVPVVVFGADDRVISSIEDSGIPIYRKARMVSSIDESSAAEMVPGQIKPLPAGVFTSQDRYEDVVRYYKKELSGFKFYDLGETKVLFIKNGPDTFDFTKNFSVYFEKEHVLIEKVEGSKFMGQDDAKTKIEITYETDR